MAGAASVRAFVRENPYFAVREIQVRGGENVGGSEIVAMAGLRHGMNMWKIEPADIERKIAKHPWVRRVLVRREFPRRVVIEVEERTPKAIVALGKLYYVDADGVVFKEVGVGESVNFPLLTGFRPEELSSSTPASRKRIQDAVRLGELMAKSKQEEALDKARSGLKGLTEDVSSLRAEKITLDAQAVKTKLSLADCEQRLATAESDPDTLELLMEYLSESR